MKTSFKVHKKWTEDEVVTRTAEVIGFDDYCPPWKQESGYNWVLNASNDWWMEKAGTESDTHYCYTIDGRYADQELMDALKIVLEYIFR